ncbi:GNAT family N-acetyltransferase [Brevundimonas sp. 2R-24]|uniref:GNAT family N-acetyltransferase n=1 Tax=Peiella sedimenti TaxID=3061083 RepID=A0ABT8SLZ5_9CAUL|nr:GNAT family N-acetyltransferase [Caulobacteraceae bacterium XZ-24]
MTPDIRTDLTEDDLRTAWRWISEESYWAKGIPWPTFERAARNSLCFGAYVEDQLAGFARVVTDRATFGWLCDVWVDEAHRGQGLSRTMMTAIKAHPDLQGFRRFHLATADAHGLYRRFGFTDLTGPDRWMEIVDRDVYARDQARSTT